MHRMPAPRLAAAAALGALAAVAAHGGPALLTDPRWTAPAVLAAIVACWAAAAGIALAGRGVVLEPGSVWATAGLLVCAQTAAHEALLAAGVMPATGQAGALGLHLALALAAALAFAAAERMLAGHARGVLARLLELLATAAAPRPWPAVEPRPALVPGARRGRSPPLG
jgi:hypothetical protein